jgi:hypothetical protein
MNRARATFLGVAATLLLGGGAAVGLDPAQKCEADKLRTAASTDSAG